MEETRYRVCVPPHRSKEAAPLEANYTQNRALAAMPENPAYPSEHFGSASPQL